ncbi:hypothetical protein HZS_7353, partial [Henneguya salminicola]
MLAILITGLVTYFLKEIKIFRIYIIIYCCVLLLKIIFTALMFILYYNLSSAIFYLLTKNIQNYNYYTQNTIIQDFIQSTFHCCGVSWPFDYLHLTAFNCQTGICGVPFSCCKNIMDTKCNIDVLNKNKTNIFL